MKTINGITYISRPEIAKAFQVSSETISRWESIYDLIPTVIGKRHYYPIEMVNQLWESIFKCPLTLFRQKGNA